ncbi:MAG: 1-hydroxycarotenoid 3 [Methylocystaceae bacterium]|nr:MAG: 1-hydroxycarotenoid 3 [Methylocystaceae bacterium]
MRTHRVVVIGAGIGGLVSAMLLATRGLDVTLIERAQSPGGKMREIEAGGVALDAGPTVMTMRWVFDQIFDEADADFSDRVKLLRLETLARHAWSQSERLDLFADPARSFDAIHAFAGKREAEGFARFCARARGIYETLRDPFILAQRPSPIDLVRHAGVSGLPNLTRISPFASMWDELGKYFRDPRLRQLFGRYATYCGSSPFLAPATLMLVAHVEMDGVWRVEGGMHRLAVALADLARDRGARIFYGQNAKRILIEGGRATGVETEHGEIISADAVVMNGDAGALRAGLLGAPAIAALNSAPRAQPSLSAVTFALRAQTHGFPLVHHNVFFSRDYRAEFDDIFRDRRLPRAPTVYVCAQDRGDEDVPAVDGAGELSTEELRQCEKRTFRFLADCGLDIQAPPQAIARTTPKDFAQLFPATGGAIYGQASHGWMASFTRPGSRTKLPGLYLAGGSAHPGPGVPMAAISGRLAAKSLMADLASTRPLRRAAIAGGMSMR